MLPPADPHVLRRSVRDSGAIVVSMAFSYLQSTAVTTPVPLNQPQARGAPRSTGASFDVTTLPMPTGFGHVVVRDRVMFAVDGTDVWTAKADGSQASPTRVATRINDSGDPDAAVLNGDLNF